MKKKRKTLWEHFTSCYLLLILLFIYLPILYVILFSFNESKSLSNFTGFSLKWYENMFQDRTMLQSILPVRSLTSEYSPLISKSS